MIYIPWFMYLEKTITSNYHIMHVWLDDLIPFNEYFIIPYLLWFPFVGGTIMYFFFTDKSGYYRLCTYLFVGMTLSLIICQLFPNGTDFRPALDPGKNIFSKIVYTLYATDTCTNVFPSIHVYNSIVTNIAVMRSEALKKHHLIRLASTVLTVSICLSTVFLKQHSVMDGFGSVMMAYVLYSFVYGTVAEPDSKKEREKAIG